MIERGMSKDRGSGVLRSTGKNGQKRNVADPFGRSEWGGNGKDDKTGNVSDPFG